LYNRSTKDNKFKLETEDQLESFSPFKANDAVFNKIVWRKDPDHRYKLKNGLGKGTKNIRARRFKRKHRYNHDEIMEVAKQLKSIIDVIRLLNVFSMELLLLKML
jgi:hypothetical protein